MGVCKVLGLGGVGIFLLAGCATGALDPYGGDAAIAPPVDLGTGGTSMGTGGTSMGTGGTSMGTGGTSMGTGGTKPPTGGSGGMGTGGMKPPTGGSGGVSGDPCKDGVKGMGETATDCGGPCPACENGKSCLVAKDCVSSFCSTTFVCGDMAAPDCTDKMKNGDETDVDCGGGTCDGCLNGKACKVVDDCASMTCTSNKCVCKPKTMAEACGTMVCGASVADGCGGTVNCGTCGAGTKCSAGACVPNTCVAGSCPGCFLATACCKADDSCGCNVLGLGCN